MKFSKLAAIVFLFITNSASAQSLDELKKDGQNTENEIGRAHV